MSRKRWLPRGFSFSWKRALGISAIKGKISRGIGIPLTKSGRQRKAGRMMGCLLPVLVVITLVLYGCAPQATTSSSLWHINILAAEGGKVSEDSCTEPKVTKTDDGYVIDYSHWYTKEPQTLQVLGNPTVSIDGPTTRGER